MYVIAGGLLLGLGRHLHQDESVQKVRLDARRRKVGAVGLEENHADDIVAHVTLPLKLYQHIHNINHRSYTIQV